MSARSKKQPRSAQVVTENATPPSSEPRAQDDGFVYPLGENAEISAAKYFCASASCPGYAYRASDQPHPFETCVSIVNATNSSIKEEDFPVVEAPSRTEPVNDQPELARALPYGVGSDVISSTIAVVNRLQSRETPAPAPVPVPVPPPPPVPLEHESHDMPPLEPDDLAPDEQGFADDSPAAHGVPLEVVETTDEPLPSPREAIIDDRLPRLVTDAEGREKYLVASLIGPKNRNPRVGSCWTEVFWLEHLHCYEVNGVNASEGFALCTFHNRLTNARKECLIRLAHFVNDDLAPYLTRPAFIDRTGYSDETLGVVLPFLEDPDRRGLQASLPISTYVPKLGSFWLEDLPAPQTKAVYRVTGVDETVRMRSGPTNDVGVAIHYADGQEARGVLDFSRFLDGTLRYLPALEDLPDWVYKTTAPPAAAKQPAPPPYVDPTPGENPMDAVSQHCGELALELGVQPLHVLRLFDGALSTFLSVVTLKELANTSPAFVAMIEKLKTPQVAWTIRQIFEAATQEGKATLEEGLEQMILYINKTLEPRVDELEKLSEQLDALRVTYGNLSEDILARLVQVETRMDDVEGGEQKPKQAKPARQHESPSKSPVERKRDRRARDKRRREAEAKKRDRSKASKPKKKTVSKAGPVDPKSAQSRPPKNKARPIAAKARKPAKPAPLGWGKYCKTPKILKLLGRIVPSQSQKFLDQARTKLPDLNLTPWTSAEQGIFAQWYFTNRNAFTKR